MLAPICLFTYNRLAETKLTVEALQNNFLAPESDLIIFSDGPKNAVAEEKVRAVREWIKTIEGFKSVIIYESPSNKGLANSIIDGVSKVIKEYGKVIVLEDDLLTSKNFLDFMNQALEFYENDEKVVSVCGYSSPISLKNGNDDVYFTHRSSSWGWATWQKKWLNVDWEVSHYNEFKKSSGKRTEFNKMGSDMTKMLNDQMQNKINSWAIRYCFHQFNHRLFSVHPTKSKIVNIGVNPETATHTTEKYNRFKTTIDQSNKRNFIFIDPALDSFYLRQFLKPFTLASRIKYKIFNTFF